jgi:hypothetical protein
MLKCWMRGMPWAHGPARTSRRSFFPPQVGMDVYPSPGILGISKVKFAILSCMHLSALLG